MRNLVIGSLLATLAATGCKKENSEPEPTAKVTSPEVVTTPDGVQAPETDTASAVPITATAPAAVALLRDGLGLAEGFRFAEATAKYDKALEIDPNFARAHAELANMGKGEVADKHRARAAELSKDLPEAERLLIKSMVGESAKEREATLKKLAALVPKDWEVQVKLARSVLKSGKQEEAREAFEKASALNPKAPYPHNNLAYIYAEQGDFDKAVASVTKYAELLPGEPNPLDSKGEMLLMAGKFAESEAAFAKALELDPTFALAHEGIAATKFYRDDWNAGIDHLRLATKKATRPVDRFDLGTKLAWALASSGKMDKAKQAFAAAELAAREAGIEKRAGSAETLAAELAMAKGDFKSANRHANAALLKMKAANTPAKKMHWARAISIIGAARSGEKDAAGKALASLQVDAKGSHYLALAETHVAITTGQDGPALAAAAELENDGWFRGRAKMLTAEVYEKAGKKEKADAVRDELARRYRRDIHSVILAAEAKKAGQG